MWDVFYEPPGNKIAEMTLMVNQGQWGWDNALGHNRHIHSLSVVCSDHVPSCSEPVAAHLHKAQLIYMNYNASVLLGRVLVTLRVCQYNSIGL